MKKKILFIAVFSLFVVTAKAQVIQGTSNVGYGSNDNDGAINIGVKAGIGMSTFYASGLIDVSFIPSFSIGGIAEIPVLFDGLYFQPELVVTRQGAEFSTNNLNLFYVHVPLLAKYHITDEIAIELGPQIGFLIADNWDEGVDTNKVNLGLNLGAGYRLDENFYFQLGVSTGFTKILDTADFKNIAFQVGAAYFFL